MPLSESVLARLRAAAPQCRAPLATSRVEKDECMFSFDNVYSPEGLYTNLNTWQSFGRDYVERDFAKNQHCLYLLQKFFKHKRLPKKADDTDEEKEVTKLGLGIEGGFSFDSDGIEIEKTYAIALLPEFCLIPLDSSELPLVSESANAMIVHMGTAAHESVKSFDDFVKESKHSESLLQLPVAAGVKVSHDPKDWHCAQCGATENLWFNLSDGYIGCGRRQPDGSGGCGEALTHFRASGSQYPLSVKLGTITPKGADVFSYAEDDMVTDKKLAEHLSHWGIDIMTQEKTEKTMEELNIDLNKKFVFGLITEEGMALEKARGPGFMGFDNLGNSCYMNSLLQVLFSLPEMKAKYLEPSTAILATAPNDPSEDLISQCAKLAAGLYTDRYIKQDDVNYERETALFKSKCEAAGIVPEVKDGEEEEDGGGVRNVSICPRVWKRLVGSGHEDFSSNRQQDSAHYMRHVLEMLHRRERVSTRIDKRIPSLKHVFKLNMEERLECAVSHAVRYSLGEELILPLPICLDDVVNADEVAAYESRRKKREEEAEAEAKKKATAAGIEVDAVLDADGDVDMDLKKKIEMFMKPVIEMDDDKVLAIIPFNSCVERFFGTGIVEDWISPVTKVRGIAYKRQSIASFPKYLAIQISRYYYDDKWTAQKYDVVVDVPLTLDLEKYRAKGLQSAEMEMPRDSAAHSGAGAGAVSAVAVASVMEADLLIVTSLTSMGFSENAAKRAALAVSNAGVEAASEWLFGHLEDADINDPPLPPEPVPHAPTTSPVGSEVVINPEVVQMLSMGLGFSAEYVTVALKHTNGDGDRAAEWLFSHESTLAESVTALKAEQDADATEGPSFTDGRAQYKLFAIVSHLGKMTSHGHYVAHLRKGDDWYIFNDSKVAKSKKPPFGHGYLYFFERTSDEASASS